MFEWFAILLGRHLHVHGVGRLLGWLFPCRTDSTRFVQGTRTRGDGLLVEVDTRQLIDWSLLFHGEYEPHLRPLFRALLTPGAIAIDVGANVGAHALTLASMVGPTGRVLAFEPNPVVRAHLERNVALNSFQQIEVFSCALGAVETRLSLRVPAAGSAESANPGLASLVALDTPHDLVEVDVHPLDAFVTASDLLRVDMVKIDVQGYECQVFHGMTQLIDRFAPAIVFEYEDWAWSKAGSNLQDVFEILHKRSYSFWSIESEGDLRLRAVSPTAFRGTHVDMLAIADADPRMATLRSAITEPADG